jgi:hypothetical protein
MSPPVRHTSSSASSSVVVCLGGAAGCAAGCARRLAARFSRMRFSCFSFFTSLFACFAASLSRRCVLLGLEEPSSRRIMVRPLHELARGPRLDVPVVYLWGALTLRPNLAAAVASTCHRGTSHTRPLSTVSVRPVGRETRCDRLACAWGSAQCAGTSSTQRARGAMPPWLQKGEASLSHRRRQREGELGALAGPHLDCMYFEKAQRTSTRFAERIPTVCRSSSNSQGYSVYTRPARGPHP